DLFPLGNDEQAVARLAFLEHRVADRELLLAAHFRHAGELAVVQVLEDRRLLQQIQVHADEAMGRRREGQVKPLVTWADLLTALRLPLAAAFITVARADVLHPLEIAGVLGRDIVAALGYVGAWLLRHPMTLPARAGGKAVTVLQLLTLVACIVRSPHVRSIAWATTAVGLY